jgi:hypothetical protein
LLSTNTSLKSKKKGYNSRKTPTCVIPSTESVPAGTTWIFTDGSQVKSSNTAASEDDNQGMSI